MKSSVVSLICLLAVLSSGGDVYLAIKAPKASSLEHSVVRIEQGYAGSHEGGSGVYLGNGLILTARHIVLSKEDDTTSALNTLFVETHDGHSLPAAVLYFSQDRDFAVLKIGANTLAPVQLTCRAPKMDEAVTLIGNPLLLINWGVAHGNVATDSPVDIPDIDEFHTTALAINALPGDSGAPVFDTDGDVLGIYVAGTPVYGSMVSSTDICAELPRS